METHNIIWPVYLLALAYQVNSAVWRLAGRLPSRLLQNTLLKVNTPVYHATRLTGQ
jgi:hypothetical protein